MHVHQRFSKIGSHMKCKNSYLTEFSANWLTDWQTYLLTNASDKRNLIMAIIHMLDFFTNQFRFILRSAAAAPMLASWFYQSLSLFSFVLHSFFHYCVQYSSQVTSRVHALRGMRAREKLVRLQGRFMELQAKPKSLESLTIANLPVRLLLRVLHNHDTVRA